MNTEFPRSTLIWSMENNMIHVKCKYKGCHHRLSFQFDVNEQGEMIKIRRKKIIDYYHFVSAHLARKLKSSASQKEDLEWDEHELDSLQEIEKV